MVKEYLFLSVTKENSILILDDDSNPIDEFKASYFEDLDVDILCIKDWEKAYNYQRLSKSSNYISLSCFQKERNATLFINFNKKEISLSLDKKKYILSSHDFYTYERQICSIKGSPEIISIEDKYLEQEVQ